MENTEALLKKINEDIKKVLSEKRYHHSIGVMKKAEELAKKYKIDVDKARLVGLAHDIAKDMSKEEKLQYVKEHHIPISEIEEENVELLHAKIGADICKEEYGFSQDMQNAILYHTVANVSMDDLAKILFIADKTEEGRKYLDFEKIHELEQKSLEEQLVYFIDESICYTIDKKALLDLNSVDARNYFLKIKK